MFLLSALWLIIIIGIYFIRKQIKQRQEFMARINKLNHELNKILGIKE